jgi:hypothetical protein
LGPGQRPGKGDIRIHLLARDELQLVDDVLVAGRHHRHEDAVVSYQHGQDAMTLRDLARQQVEVLQAYANLREVDARHAVLLGQRLESLQVDLLVLDRTPSRLHRSLLESDPTKRFLVVGILAHGDTRKPITWRHLIRGPR